MVSPDWRDALILSANIPVPYLQPYSEYKDTGFPWLGKVPVHWEITNIGAVLRERGEKNSDGKITEVLSVLKDRGVILYSEKGNIGNKKSDDISRYKIVRLDDIVLNSMNVIIGSVGLSRYTGCLSPVYYVLTRRSSTDNPHYLNAYFQTKPFQQSLVRIGNGILAHRMRIPMELLKYEPFPIPPCEEQNQIVRFLEYFDSRFTRLTRLKRKQIALLNEQKQAIIQQAVTRGLDPDVRLKPSGVEWLGDIPEHWEVKPLKFAARIQRGKFTHRPRNDPELYDGPYRFIQTGDVARADKIIKSYTQTLNEKGLSVSKMFSEGTLVMTIAANIGDVAILGFNACFPDSIVGLTPKIGVDQEYLFYIIKSMKKKFLLDAPVNTQGNLNVERIGKNQIPIPPLLEQQVLVKLLEKETKELSKAIGNLQNEINLINEYRTRLIADVVTGKLDVRGVELPEIETIEDEETFDEAGDLPEDELEVEIDGQDGYE